jgi:ankyrin repeat protein
MIACLQNKEEAVDILIEAGADLEIKDKQGKTALFHAVAMGNIGFMLKLMATGAEINSFDSNGRTPLLQACVNGNMESMKVLLDKGCSAIVKDSVRMNS